MDNAFSRLLKVISLERKQGYRNKAVIGGLDKFASRWETDARTETADQTAVSEIVSLLIGYPAVSEATARERIAKEILRRAKAAAPGQVRPPAEKVLPGEVSAGQPAPTVPAKGAARPAEPGRVTGLPAGVEVRPAVVRPAPDVMPLVPPSERQPPAPAWEPPPVPAPEPAPAFPRESHGPPLSRPGAELTAPARPVEEPRKTAPTLGLPAPAPSPFGDLRPVGPGDAPVTRLPGVGPVLAEKLARLGVRTIHDLLYLLPRRHDDFSHLRTIDRLSYGEEVTVIGTVWNIERRRIGEERIMITAVVGDGTAEMQMTWFNPYVERRLRTGRPYVFSGKIDSYRGRLLMRNPELEPLERDQIHTGRLVPVYPLTQGLSDRWLRRLMKSTVDAWAPGVPDFLPEEVRQEARLLSLATALAQVHFPDNQDVLAAARRRLSFDEFFLLQLGVQSYRQRLRGQPAQPLIANDTTLAPFLAALPFAMTAAQRRALSQIVGDLGGTQPMSRLLQGDVGSGKTAVAAAALWVAVANAAQGAIMAPTEILAEQHARSFGSVFAGLVRPGTDRPVRVELFTGRKRKTERDAALAALAAGEIDIAVGTHALIQENVTFRDLAVAVVDEQHRFGVEQRAALRQRGLAPERRGFLPHVLVMSATPIPRSLALTIYGDLDISVIDEMPPGRTAVKTKWLTSAQRERAYEFIRRQVAAGRQAFIICPLVEVPDIAQQPCGPSEVPGTSAAKAAVDEHARLQKEIFPGLRVGLVHGRLRSDEKDSVMRTFAAGELDILVATSVVEVGIDVPNATVIMIEGAERFGLAQLHQFRGRVGRGEHPSYCILVSDAAEGESTQRLQALETNNDGFALAQIDLEMRGPGDFFGTRQSGLPPLRMAQLSDLRTLELARTAAQKLFAADPDLSRPEHRLLAAQVAAFWTGAGDVS
jgi:ATP-dependent DNA helicase RecG